MRRCIDYWKQNGITKPDLNTMPRVEELVDGLSQAQYIYIYIYIYISIINLTRCWQVPVQPGSRTMTAFCDTAGQTPVHCDDFRPGVLAKYQHLMNTLLAEVREFLVVYIDDVIYSTN